jgi:hypothetical protein
LVSPSRYSSNRFRISAGVAGEPPESRASRRSAILTETLVSPEERSFQEQLDQKAHAYPEMVPLLVIRVEGGGHE